MGGGSLVLGCFQVYAGAGAQSTRPFRLKQKASYTHLLRLRRGIQPLTTTTQRTQAQAQSTQSQVESTQSQAQSTQSQVEITVSRIDKSGRFCSPRAARELALLILYASCLEGTDPLRLLEKRLNAPKELYYEFDKSCLLSYNHMSFGGPPITATTMDEANQLLNQHELESATEAEVLSAPPKLVYSNLLLRFTKKLLTLVVDRWDSHVLIIDQVIPPNWKIDPAGRILEFSILHLAMSEISGVGTRHQIVINEAVDLAKRFCDGAAPRIINGCLRTYVQNRS